TGFKLVNSNKNNVLINNEIMVSLSKEIKQYRSEYKQIESACSKKVIDVASTYYPLFERLVYILSEIDVLVSFATVVENSNQVYVKPIVTEEKKLILKESRHLILEWNDDIIKKNNPNIKTLVSNDCVMDTTNCMLLTGINMGGKSTYLRQVG